MSFRNTEVEFFLEDGDTREVEMPNAPDRNGQQESSASQVDGHSMSDVSIPMDWEPTLNGQDGQATRGYSEGDVHDASQLAGRQINAERQFTERLSAIEDNQQKILCLLEHASVPRDLPQGPDASGPGPSDESALDSDGDAEMS